MMLMTMIRRRVVITAAPAGTDPARPATLSIAQVVPTARHHSNRWAEVVQNADRSVTLIDLCGHERYLKTTVFGLTGGYDHHMKATGQTYASGFC
jgi:hypothetical protein